METSELHVNKQYLVYDHEEGDWVKCELVNIEDYVYHFEDQSGGEWDGLAFTVHVSEIKDNVRPLI